MQETAEPPRHEDTKKVSQALPSSLGDLVVRQLLLRNIKV
jgi:hypothetical protein